VIEKLKRAWRDGLRDLPSSAEGFVELQNSVYTESNIAIPAWSAGPVGVPHQQSLRRPSPDRGPHGPEKSSGPGDLSRQVKKNINRFPPFMRCV